MDIQAHRSGIINVPEIYDIRHIHGNIISFILDQEAPNVFVAILSKQLVQSVSQVWSRQEPDKDVIAEKWKASIKFTHAVQRG